MWNGKKWTRVIRQRWQDCSQWLLTHAFGNVRMDRQRSHSWMGLKICFTMWGKEGMTASPCSATFRRQSPKMCHSFWVFPPSGLIEETWTERLPCRKLLMMIDESEGWKGCQGVGRLPATYDTHTLSAQLVVHVNIVVKPQSLIVTQLTGLMQTRPVSALRILLHRFSLKVSKHTMISQHLQQIWLLCLLSICHCRSWNSLWPWTVDLVKYITLF